MENDRMCKLSIVIPVYGSELVLTELVSQLGKTLVGVDEVRDDYEIIFVCDQSPDNSWRVIQSLSKDHSQVRGILLRMNAGQHNALMAGFAEASGEIIVTMDDDLQHSPADIPKLLLALRQGSDVAFARFKSRNHALWKIAGSWLNNFVAGLLLKKPRDLYLSPFRAMKAAICAEVLRYKGPYVYVDGLILSATRNIASVDVDHHDRYAGESRYGLVKSISLWLKMATSFSIVPLRLTSLAGILFSMLGFLLASIFVIQKFTLDRMPDGWTSLMVAVLIIGGIQLLAIGMVGEYLGRVLLTINSRAQYVIGETVGLKAKNAGN
jgi:glycosyltransferase involved in cell wall biosynthesis